MCVDTLYLSQSIRGLSGFVKVTLRQRKLPMQRVQVKHELGNVKSLLLVFLMEALMQLDNNVTV